MPINNITQTISTIPEAAHRGIDVQTVFVIKQEDFQDHLQGTTVTELNTLKDQLNSRIGEINSTTTIMNGYADTASAGASAATTKAGEASTSASDALAYKNQAETFKNNASTSATKASQWADNNYNVEVETGKYSAKHWSTVAQNTVNNKVDKVTSTDNAVVRFDGVTGQVQNSGVIIDDNGNVGIGVTPSAWGSINKAVETGNQAGQIAMYGRIDGSNGSGITQNAYRDTSNVWRYKANGYALHEEKGIGTYTWQTAPSGTAGNPITWTNAMTLDANGLLLVGSNGLNPIQGVTIRNESTIGVVDIGHASGTASGNQYNGYYYNGTLIGSILQSGTTSVVYNTTSDYRLKENIRPADCKKFMDINFVDYERIDGRHECGVIAHELQEVYPDLVTGEKDATEIRKVEISPAIEEVKDEDGNVITEAVEAVYEEQEFPVYQQVNYIGLIARIGTVVQQQAKLIEAMQLEINELKGAK